MKKKIAFCVVFVIIIAATGCFVLSSCNGISPTLDEDYSFRFHPTKTTVWGLVGVPLIFEPESGLELTKEGVITITVLVNSQLGSLLKTFDIDLSMASQLDLANMADIYGVPILPWFDITDMKTSLEMLEKSLGAELILDYEDETTVKLLEAIETTGRLPEDLTIPARFGFKYTGKYVVKKLKSEITGEEYTALYIDKYSEGGEPFFIMTLTEDEKGFKHASMNVEFLQMVMYFDEREQPTAFSAYTV